MAILNPAIAQHPSGPAYYARAVTNLYQGNRAAGAQDIEWALRAEPNNPIYRKLQQQLNAAPEKSAAKPAKKP